MTRAGSPLEDPISDWAPEFAGMRVLASPEGGLRRHGPGRAADHLRRPDDPSLGPDLRRLPQRPDLRSAIARPWTPTSTVRLEPDAWIAALAGLPLIDQPGAGFHYGVSTDLLGLLIARMEGAAAAARCCRSASSGRSASKDTGFVLSAGQQARRAKMYGFDAEGRLGERREHPPEQPAFLAERPAEMSFVSGGAGLWSTLDDYLAFARMFVGDGAVDGVRLLKVGTLRRMTANFLTDRQCAEARMMGQPVFNGQGFGLGVAVVTDPERASAMRCKGGLGTVGWPGAYGCWWQADPTDGSVMIFLAQNALDFPLAARGIGLGVYGAIMQFHALASAVRTARPGPAAGSGS